MSGEVGLFATLGAYHMTRKCLPCLLILLVASAFLDDAWAEATPDPADDAQAAENNEYLHTAPSRGDRPTRADRLPTGRPDDRPTALRVRPPSRALLAAPPPVPAPGNLLLYVFMSLQR
jgi:hypothetical protein